jgi:chromosome segregation ATPase
MDVEKLFRPSEIRRLSKDETIALYKRHMLAQHERAEAAEKHSREASQMFVSANEHITELLQQESFMERRLVAQREDIERLANRVLTAEARVTELEAELGAHKLMLKNEALARAEAAEAECDQLDRIVDEKIEAIGDLVMREERLAARVTELEAAIELHGIDDSSHCQAWASALTEPAQTEEQP